MTERWNLDAPQLHFESRSDGAIYPCYCGRPGNHEQRANTPAIVITSNEIAAAIERVQGFTVLDVRYGIADEVIEALLRLGWQPPIVTRA